MESQPACRHFISKLHLNKSSKFYSYTLNTASIQVDEILQWVFERNNKLLH